MVTNIDDISTQCTPLISVIVPMYKVEEYIEKCTRSILEQDFDDFEVIFVDDYTPDRSVEVLQGVLSDYPESRCRIVHHPENRGLAMARTTGVNVARGRYIFHIDSDDYLFPGAFRSFAIQARSLGFPDIVFGNFTNIYKDRQEPRKRNPNPDKVDYVVSILRHLEPPCIWNNLIARSLYEELEIPTINNLEDYITLPRLLYRASTFSFNTEHTYAYTHFNESSFQKNRLSQCHIADRTRAINYLLDYFLQLNAPTPIIDAVRSAIFKNCAKNLIVATTREEIRKVTFSDEDYHLYLREVKPSNRLFLILRRYNQIGIIYYLGKLARKFIR